MSDWVRVVDRLPPVPEPLPYDYNTESHEVLVWEGTSPYPPRVAIARYRVYTDPDDDGEPVWILQGRDGYFLDNVTHWRPLPSGPRS